MFRQYELRDIVSSAYIDCNGRRMELEDYEYIIVYDSNILVESGRSADVKFESVSDSLSQPISNWIASMSASYTLLVNSGPKAYSITTTQTKWVMLLFLQKMKRR